MTKVTGFLARIIKKLYELYDIILLDERYCQVEEALNVPKDTPEDVIWERILNLAITTKERILKS